MAEVGIVTDNDGEKLKAEIMKDDIRTLENWYPEGVEHKPEAGAEGIIAYIGRGRGQPVLLNPKRRDVKTIQPGETVVYSTKDGSILSEIYLDENGKLIITTDSNSDIEVNSGGKLVITTDSDITVNSSGKIRIENSAGFIEMNSTTGQVNINDNFTVDV